MHEVSLAGNILEIVEAAAREQVFAHVRRLHLSVPALAGVEVSALHFALQVVSRHTLLEGADLVIDEPASPAHCLDCGSGIEIRAHGQVCPHCGGGHWRLVEGVGVQVVDLLVD